MTLETLLPVPCAPMALHYGWLVIAGGFLMHLALGTIYCWGNATTYITSYLRRFDPTLTLDKTLAVFGLASCGMAATMFLGGILERKIGPRLTAYLGSALMVSGVLLASLAKSLWSLNVLYGALFGIGGGLAYTCPMICGLKWMPDNKGLINGCITAGFGLGAFIFNFVITAFCNPDDVQPSTTFSHNGKDKLFDPNGPVADKVPHLFLMLGGLYSAMTFVGASSYSDPPPPPAAEEVVEQLIDEAEAQPEDMKEPKGMKEPEDMKEPEGMSTVEVVQTFQGWLLWLMFIFTACGGVFVLGCYKSYGQKQSWADDDFLALLGSLISIFNCLGRFVQGMAADRFGFRPVLMCMAATQTVFLLTITLAGPHKGMYVVWCGVIAFCYGGNFALYPTATMQQFGLKHAGANYGFIFTAYGIAGVIGTMLKQDLEDQIGFEGITFMMGSICGCGVLGCFMIQKPVRPAIPTNIVYADVRNVL